MRPVERLAVDVLLEQALAHHQREVAAHAPPRRIGGLVDDVAEVVEPARLRRLAGPQPFLARLAALPGARGEAEDLDLDAAALQRARQDVGAGRGDRDRAAAHGAGIVEEQRHDGVAEGGLALLLEGERRERVDDHARQPRRVEDALLEVEIPGAVLLREQAALQPVGEPRHGAVQGRELLVEEGAQPVQLLRRAEILGVHDLVVLGGEDLVVDLRLVAAADVGPARLAGRLLVGGAVVLGEILGRRIRVLGLAGLFLLAGRFGLLVGGIPRAPARPRRAPPRCARPRPRASSPPSSSSLSDSGPSSSPMSSETSRSRTASAKQCWSSTIVPSRSSSSPAFVSIVSRQSSTSLRALFGGVAPVSRSRTISATASSIGASDCSRDVVEIGAMVLVLQHGGEVGLARPPCGASRSPRSAPARPRRRSRAPAAPRGE